MKTQKAKANLQIKSELLGFLCLSFTFNIIFIKEQQPQLSRVCTLWSLGMEPGENIASENNKQQCQKIFYVTKKEKGPLPNIQGHTCAP